MIVATYITYNDIETIQESIESIENKVDRIVVIDGKFRDFPGKHWDSTDGTLEYLLGLNIDLISSLNADQVGKRNSYLDQLSEGDICLNLDADEVLEGDIPELDTDVGLIDIFEFNDRRRHRRYNRFFRFRDGLHYWGKHYLILDKDNDCFTTLEHPTKKYTHKKIEGFRLIHKGKLRSQQRELDKKKYYESKRIREARVNEPIN